MTKFFKYGEKTASSAPVESNFNYIKNVMMKHVKLPLRSDEFVKLHIQSQEGTMKLAYASAQKMSDTNFRELMKKKQETDGRDDENLEKREEEKAEDSDAKKIKSSVKIEKQDTEKKYDQNSRKTNEEWTREVSFIENWRGLAAPPKKRFKSSYLVPQPEILLEEEGPQKKVASIGLLKNGNRTACVKIDQEKFFVTNSCAFDSIVQISASTLVDSQEYRNTANFTNQFTSLCDFVAKSKISSGLYKQRAKLLMEICPLQKLAEGVCSIKGESTISFMAQHLFKDEPSAIEKRACTNPECAYQTRELKTVVITINTNQNINSENLETAIADLLNSRYRPCTQKHFSIPCSGSITIEMKVSDRHMIIELLNTKSSKSSDVSEDLSIRLGDIPKHLKVQNTSFHLRGAVSFSASCRSINVIGHFIAFCYRGGGLWEEYNDLADKIYSCPAQTKINCQLLIYSI